MIFSASPSAAKSARSPFPRCFWIANTMEIFERMAWYGFFTVSSLYITGSVADGCLGFTSEQRGTLQGIITFILYLLPVLFGALADRFGFKKTFFASYAIMVPAYYLLGQFTSYTAFFFAFLMVAVGAAMFKPVVTGTVAKATDDTNSHFGFGIFYMMVNIGGLLGPVCAGILRGWSWKYIFLASAGWIAINFFWLSVFYKEPTSEATSKAKRTVKKVLSDIVEVLGNLRFFITVFATLIILMIASKGWLSWGTTSLIVALWILANLLVDLPLRKAGGKAFMPPMKVGNWRFALYLLILSGFWTSFNQIFMTMPEYIRDFVNTGDMLHSLGGFFAFISPIKIEHIVRVLGETLPQVGSLLSSDQLRNLTEALLSARIRLAPEQLQALIQQFTVVGQAVSPQQLSSIAEQAIKLGHQVNPEYLIKFDAASIVCFQLLVSFIIAKWKPFSAMIGGIIMASIGLAMAAFMHDGWPVVTAIVFFAFGEMMASPKSQEYISRIAPPDKKAMYMGYYFWAVALGNLFGGLLSGQLYGWLARDLQRPDLMWFVFGGLSLVTALALIAYDRLVVRKMGEGVEMV
ncbi:MAG: MFS transporter [bacterium]|nr:MFS transporter [bacterium]